MNYLKAVIPWAACTILGCTSGMEHDSGTGMHDDAASHTGDAENEDTNTSEESLTDGDFDERVEINVNRDVDILFVIDDSASMGEEQGNLAANFPAFLRALDPSDVAANYRIGITSTDNGHRDCRGSRPGSGGILRVDSCLDRAEEFIDPAHSISRFNTACAAHCRWTSDELELRPTTTDADSQTSPRPWLETVAGRSNLPEEITMEQAFACVGPQGIQGCGYEAQLESMYRALGLSLEPTQDSFGFMRDQAVLAIIHVTDEADCSYNPRVVGDVVFSPDDTTFWANPEVGPNSSICWNAGVECRGDAGGFYESCEVVNRDVDARELADAAEDQAVLHPLNRYYAFIDAIEAQKKDFDNHRELIVALIGGVSLAGETAYPIDSGSWHFDEFGVGPGCIGTVSVLDETDPETGELVPAKSNVDSFAVPPVRLRDFVAHYAEEGDPSDSMFSVCDDDYESALERIGRTIRGQLAPACYHGCPRDGRPKTEWLEPECKVIETYKDQTVELPECTFTTENLDVGEVKVYDWRQGTGYKLPEGAQACFALRVDADGTTESPADDLDEACRDDGFPLQFSVQRARGSAAKSGSIVQAMCERSKAVAIDCPYLVD